MRDETWQVLEELFSDAPVLKAGEIPVEEVETAEREIGIALSEDYKEFIRRYGGAIVGAYRIFGLRRAAPMGKSEGSFVEVTANFRRQNWPGVEAWAIVSMDHGGNPVGLDDSGKIWISDHDAGAVQVIAADFEEYLRKRCLNLSD